MVRETAANTLCLSCRERARTGASHTMLHVGQNTSNHSILLKEKILGEAAADSRADNGTESKLFDVNM